MFSPETGRSASRRQNYIVDFSLVIECLEKIPYSEEFQFILFAKVKMLQLWSMSICACLSFFTNTVQCISLQSINTNGAKQNKPHLLFLHATESGRRGPASCCIRLATKTFPWVFSVAQSRKDGIVLIQLFQIKTGICFVIAYKLILLFQSHTVGSWRRRTRSINKSVCHGWRLSVKYSVKKF